jgi:superfamily II DNA or RNA helicase
VINMSEAQLLLTKTDMATAETTATSSIADLVPRDYQLAAVDTVMKAFSNTVSHTNSVIGLRPGTGKTFVMCLAMRELFKRGVRYGIDACPNRSSTTQMYETVASFFGETITSTLVSMDGSTAFRLELEPPAKPHVYVSTFKSMDIVVDQVHEGMTRQNTVVFYDEAHHQEVMNLDQYLYHWSQSIDSQCCLQKLKRKATSCPNNTGSQAM